MVVIDKKQFLKLPDGTLYCKIGEDTSLRIKHKTVGTTWTYSELYEAEGKDDSERTAHWNKAFNDSSYNVPMTTNAVFRDGMYEGGTFIVYSKDEIRQMVKALIGKTGV